MSSMVGRSYYDGVTAGRVTVLRIVDMEKRLFAVVDEIGGEVEYTRPKRCLKSTPHYFGGRKKKK